MKRGHFFICYRIHFTIYYKDIIINQQRISEFACFLFIFYLFILFFYFFYLFIFIFFFFWFFLLLFFISLNSQKYKGIWEMLLKELMSLHLYVQSSSSHLYNVDKVSLKK